MFNKDEEKNKAERRYIDTVGMIDYAAQMEDEHHIGVSFVTSDAIFLKETTVDKMEDIFFAMEEVFGTYKMNNYYAGSEESCLAIKYLCGDKKVVAFVSPREDALNRVSGGKCSLQVIDRKETVVVCGGE